MSDNYLVEQLGHIWDELGSLKQQRVIPKVAQVVAADSTTSRFDADLPDGQRITGISAPTQFLPAAGEWVRLTLSGATLIYEPAGIAENAVTGREIALGSVTPEQLAFNVADYAGGTTVHYGSIDPDTDPEVTLNVGDLWLQEVDAGPPPEYVTKRWTPDGWAELADQSATAALLTAEAAQAAADGKLKLYEETSAPTHTGAAGSAIWRDTDDGNVTYSWDGSQWQPRRIGNGAIQPNSLVASNVIATGTVSAGLLEAVLVLANIVIAGDPDGYHARMTEDGFQVLVPSPLDGAPPYVAIRQGDPTGRSTFGIPDESGQLLANINEKGFAGFSGLSTTTEPRFEGRLLSEIIDAQAGDLWHGVFAYDVNGISSVETGIFEVPFTAKPGRIYEVAVSGVRVATSDAVNGGALFLIRDTGTTGIPEQYRFEVPKIDKSGFREGVNFSFPWINPTAGQHRACLSTAAIGGGALHVQSPGIRMTVRDIGKAQTNLAIANTLGGGSTPAPTVRRQSVTLGPSWWGSYNGSGNAYGAAGLYQGQDPSGFNGNTASLIGFDDLTGVLNGATIENIGLRLYAAHWWNGAGGTARIGAHGHTSKPGTFTGAIDPARITIPGWPRGEPRWVDLTAWANDFKSGAVRGVALGPGVGSDMEYYGRFDAPGQGYPPILSITYVK